MLHAPFSTIKNPSHLSRSRPQGWYRGFLDISCTRLSQIIRQQCFVGRATDGVEEVWVGFGAGAVISGLS